MLTLGIIGTGSISHHFIEAAHASHRFQLVAVYSRKLETATEFASSYTDVNLYDNFDQFLKASFDFLYIASPNSLHFAQAKAALATGKHVIIEKPAVTKPEEWQELVDLAKEKQVYLIEAARNYHEAAFAVISEFLADKKILGADFSYAKYSSKMPDLLAGKKPNVFSERFAGGALMDLGIYPLYAAVSLFGKPTTASYQARQLENSIDLNGDGILSYSDFQVHIKAGKNITSNLPCEIYTTDGTLTLNSIEHIHSAVFTNHHGQEIILPIQQAPHTMSEELAAIIDLVDHQDQESYQKWLHDAATVHQLLYTMRQSAGIHFEAES